MTHAEVKITIRVEPTDGSEGYELIANKAQIETLSINSEIDPQEYTEGFAFSESRGLRVPRIGQPRWTLFLDVSAMLPDAAGICFVQNKLDPK